MQTHALSHDILTVDLEDWYHVLPLSPAAAARWALVASHIEDDTLRLLEVLDRHGAHATFFVIGRVAEQAPDLIREIVRRGHSVASHGFDHVPPEAMTRDEFAWDLRRSKETIEGVIDTEVTGFRAPWFGIRGCGYPFFEILSEQGFIYDSSCFPGICPGRGLPEARRGPKDAAPQKCVIEVTVSVVSMLTVPFAFSGGGFLRLLPFWFVKWGIHRTHEAGRPVVYYLHPRDLNPRSPVMLLSTWRRVRYYGGRRRMERKLDTLLNLNHCVSIEHHLHDEGQIP